MRYPDFAVNNLQAWKTAAQTCLSLIQFSMRILDLPQQALWAWALPESKQKK
ncbi:MAG: DUF3623 family protein [Zoogloeaceae bacterium]|nr:DUF3623 family protein [Zoogloeaceae bacterium]